MIRKQIAVDCSYGCRCLQGDPAHPSYNPTMPSQDCQRIRLSTLRRWTQDRKPFAMLTCYDATTAGWLWRGGVQTLLVGDTAGQFILGHDSTLPVSLEFMLQITAAVRRGAPLAFVMGDMPFGSYQCGDDAAMANAIRFLTDGGADAVKLEVDGSFRGLVGRLSSAGVPVVAHLGSRPQLKKLQGGGSRRVYRTQAQVQATVDEAVGMVEAGAVMLLFEAVPAEIPQQVSADAAGESCSRASWSTRSRSWAAERVRPVTAM